VIRVSEHPTPYAVHCSGLIEGHSCGLVYLTPEEYDRQMMAAHRRWRCPICKAEAEWDDENYEQAMGGDGWGDEDDWDDLDDDDLDDDYWDDDAACPAPLRDPSQLDMGEEWR
jgi:hypothetical protein